MIFRQYTRFLINGGVIGLIAWAVHTNLLFLFSENSSISYAIASFITYVPLVLLNFFIQRRLIFCAGGYLSRFIVASILIMFLVSILSPICRQILVWLWGEIIGNGGGFVLAALIGATPSFLLSKYFVFKTNP